MIISKIKEYLSVRGLIIRGDSRLKSKAKTLFVGGVLSDGTAYRTRFVPGRAIKITKVTAVAGVAPIGGVSTIDVKRVAANTSVLAAALDPTTLVANTPKDIPLAADATVAANETVEILLTTGTMGTDAQNVAVTVEYEYTDI